MQSALDELASRVRSISARCRKDPQAFSQEVAAVLRGFPCALELDRAAVTRWVAASTALPAQLDVRQQFGDPPITLFRDDDFVIDVYFWLAPRLAIHDHGFSGAFAIVEGSTVQVRYELGGEERVDEHLAIGELHPVGTDTLEAGQVVAVPGGRSFIHSTLHLGVPTVSLCVRTIGDGAMSRQRSYLAPGVAFVENTTELVQRQLSLLRFHSRLGRPQLDAWARELLGATPLHARFLVLKHHLELTSSLGRTLALLEVSGFPARVAAAVGAALDRYQGARLVDHGRMAKLGALPRLVVGLLQSLSTREQILYVIRRHFPTEDAEQRLLDGLLEAARAEALPIDLDEPARAVLAGALRSHHRGDTERARETYDRLAQVDLLRPLFV